jgi:hypothetical protein
MDIMRMESKKGSKVFLMQLSYLQSFSELLDFFQSRIHLWRWRRKAVVVLGKEAKPLK